MLNYKYTRFSLINEIEDYLYKSKGFYFVIRYQKVIIQSKTIGNNKHALCYLQLCYHEYLTREIHVNTKDVIHLIDKCVDIMHVIVQVALPISKTIGKTSSHCLQNLKKKYNLISHKHRSQYSTDIS